MTAVVAKRKADEISQDDNVEKVDGVESVESVEKLERLNNPLVRLESTFDKIVCSSLKLNMHYCKNKILSSERLEHHINKIKTLTEFMMPTKTSNTGVVTYLDDEDKFFICRLIDFLLGYKDMKLEVFKLVTYNLRLSESYSVIAYAYTDNYYGSNSILRKSIMSSRYDIAIDLLNRPGVYDKLITVSPCDEQNFSKSKLINIIKNKINTILEELEKNSRSPMSCNIVSQLKIHTEFLEKIVLKFNNLEK